MILLFKGKKRIILLLLIVLIDSVLFSAAQTRNIPLSNPVNLEVLSYNESSAKDFFSKNLNRFAVEKLQKYDYLLDSLYKTEKKDTLASIERAYRLNSATKISAIDNLNKKIIELSAQKEKLESRYWELVRKAILSFVLWISIVLFLLQFRKRRSKKVNAKLQSTTAQLQSLEESAINTEKLASDFTKLKEPLQKLSSEFAKLRTVIAEAGTKQNTPSEWNDISSKSALLTRNIELEEKILNAVLSQNELPKEEKATTDINSLCEQFLEIAYRGIQKTDEFNCQVSRDFEKKISPIIVNPAAVGSLLLNVLTNAFQSVKEQNSRGIKGYQPKVSISTRILPRFLQIRIKDNGTGMKEEILKKTTNEFFSTRPLAEGSGLGLYVANTVISDMHKGEIKIESEVGTSTDVYIKFFI